MAEKIITVSRKGCVEYANHLIELCGLPFPRILSVENINSNFLLSLFEYITGVTVKDALQDNDSVTEAHNIQMMIDTLSLDVLNISLSHLTGEDIIHGNIISILNLLQVLETLILCLCSSKENDSYTPGTSSKHNSSRKISSFKCPVSSSDKKTLHNRILKRKTGKVTWKPHMNLHTHENTEMSELLKNEPVESSDQKRHIYTVDIHKSPLKRKMSKPSSRIEKRLHAEDIEKMYESNFKKKVRALLQSDESPIFRAHQMKKNYIQTLKRPVKKTSIPACKKSFLLPHNLRHKSNLSIQQSPVRKKTSQKKKTVKYPISENTAELRTPAFIQSVMKEFPGFKCPKNSLELIKAHYYKHVGLMHKQLRDVLLKKPTTQIQTENAIADEVKLNKILTKDLKEKKYLRKLNEQKSLENKIKFGFRDARLQSAKTRQYFDEFQKSMSRKLQKRNFAEEILVEQTFKNALDLQKEKVRLLCQKMRETDEQDAKQHRQYLHSLKNLYKDQLALLAESVNTEHEESTERTKAQKWAIEKMNQEFRKNLQKEVRSLHKDVLELIEDIHFRELDAQNFITSFQQQD